ncbi:unnamed protein product [Hymenolepis diminuta]|uniref:Glutathione peroxidase n=1 Tax=Hymenolepis diminuta TaxID=6216 RepID=A0A564YGL9_HYMDI|nr:unnamed protein product [Hymenolepis diminuta]
MFRVLKFQGRSTLSSFSQFRRMASSEVNFYSFEALDIDGNNVSMEKYRGKEPGTNAEIKETALNKFGVTFDMFSKIDVNGSTGHPLFLYLQKALKGTLYDSIKWNFTKFLIDRNGIPQNRYSPTTDPLSFENDIEDLL